MLFTVQISDVRPVKALNFEIDLARNKLVCIVGKNGSGKTTLAKAVRSFARADTFTRTSSDGIFRSSSTIRYRFGNQEFVFSYDPALGTLNSKTPIPESLKSQISVELPIPHGQRFNYFRTLSDTTDDVKKAIILEQYRRPDELIEYLSRIYGERRFEQLVEIKLRTGSCCCILQPDGRYVREDYFSSGEYFLINLYRQIQQGRRLLVIDEIDISLDPAAQARLAGELRVLRATYGVNVVFTSHSLAMMQTLSAGELVYMERTAEGATLSPVSFGYVKSLMFGFRGCDKYILTEDEVLKDFLEYLIVRYCPPRFFSYSIIEVAGGAQVVDLMRRNRAEEFSAPEDNVISVLDGDQRQEGHAQARNTHCMPLQNVEQALWDEYQRTDFEPKFLVQQPFANPKALYRYVTRHKILSRDEIFQRVCDRHDQTLREFARILDRFLCRLAAG